MWSIKEIENLHFALLYLRLNPIMKLEITNFEAIPRPCFCVELEAPTIVPHALAREPNNLYSSSLISVIPYVIKM